MIRCLTGRWLGLVDASFIFHPLPGGLFRLALDIPLSISSFNMAALTLFEIQIIKNGFTGPISYRVFRETGPWAFNWDFTVPHIYAQFTRKLRTFSGRTYGYRLYKASVTWSLGRWTCNPEVPGSNPSP